MKTSLNGINLIKKYEGLVLQSEIWADVPDYEGIYQISNYGRVKSVSRTVYHSITKKQIIIERYLKQSKASNGYLNVVLYKNGKRFSTGVHRLVAKAFIPNDKNLPQVNHKDEDKTNNFVENLEWCDSQYNCNYGERTERGYQKQRGIYNTPSTSYRIIQYTLSGEYLQEFPSIREAMRQTKIDSSCIVKVCKNKRLSAGGFKWKYKKQAV